MTDTLTRRLRLPPGRALEARIKAQLLDTVQRAVAKSGVTHAYLAERSGIPRSAVTGILSGSMQKVTIDRVLRLCDAAGLTVEIRIR